MDQDLGITLAPHVLLEDFGLACLCSIPRLEGPLEKSRPLSHSIGSLSSFPVSHIVWIFGLCSLSLDLPPPGALDLTSHRPSRSNRVRRHAEDLSSAGRIISDYSKQAHPRPDS
jgi:hypothetical protein